jgi:hypothetical protein
MCLLDQKLLVSARIVCKLFDIVNLMVYCCVHDDVAVVVVIDDDDVAGEGYCMEYVVMAYYGCRRSGSCSCFLPKYLYQRGGGWNLLGDETSNFGVST